MHSTQHLIVHVEQGEVLTFGKPLDATKELVGGDGVFGGGIVAEVVGH